MIITMNQRELHRLETLNKVLDNHLSKVDAAQLLNLSIRQLYRLINRYKKEGVKGLVSKKCGQPSNRSYPDYFGQYVLDIIKELYVDFRPTLAAEKLLEKHDISLAIETIRVWMRDEGIWTTRRDKRKQVHQPLGS